MVDKPRILIADDEESFLLSTGELLRLEGFEVHTAHDGREAAAMLNGQTFDLLITDIRMPGNQDLDLVRYAQAQNDILPVIMVTSYPSMPTAMQAMQLSVIAYLIKPMDFAAGRVPRADRRGPLPGAGQFGWDDIGHEIHL